jgi:hypothetical protein
VLLLPWYQAADIVRRLAPPSNRGYPGGSLGHCGSDKVFWSEMNISVGDRVVLPSGRCGVVVVPAGNPVIPSSVLVQLDKPEGGLRCLWANESLVNLCP